MTALLVLAAAVFGAAGGALATHRLHQHRWEAAHWDRIRLAATRVRDLATRNDHLERLNRRLITGGHR